MPRMVREEELGAIGLGTTLLGKGGFSICHGVYICALPRSKPVSLVMTDDDT